MKIINKDIRPVGYVTLELNENEVQCIISTIEQIQFIYNRSLAEVQGLRGEIYKELLDVLGKVKPAN